MLGTEMQSIPEGRRPRLHLVAHSAGAILFGHLLARWGTPGLAFRNLVLMAPACTNDFFKQMIKPALASSTVEALTHFHLDDESERGDSVARVYQKSLLYLVSRSFQQKRSVVPLMGMAKYIDRLDDRGVKNRVRHLNPIDNPDWTTSRRHGEFDNDEPTMNRMLELVVDRSPVRRFTGDDLSGY